MSHFLTFPSKHWLKTKSFLFLIASSLLSMISFNLLSLTTPSLKIKSLIFMTIIWHCPLNLRFHQVFWSIWLGARIGKYGKPQMICKISNHHSLLRLPGWHKNLSHIFFGLIGYLYTVGTLHWASSFARSKFFCHFTPSFMVFRFQVESDSSISQGS